MDLCNGLMHNISTHEAVDGNVVQDRSAEALAICKLILIKQSISKIGLKSHVSMFYFC